MVPDDGRRFECRIHDDGTARGTYRQAELTMPNEIDVAGLRELEGKATPGPWQTRFLYRMWSAVRNNSYALGLFLRGDTRQDWADAELCAEMRNALPALLDEIERLRELDPCDACQLSVKSAEAERDALQKRVKELEAANGEIILDVLTARDERDELKAKLERVRGKCVDKRYPRPLDSYEALAVNAACDEILAILDGKEG